MFRFHFTSVCRVAPFQFFICVSFVLLAGGPLHTVSQSELALSEACGRLSG